MTKRLLSMSMKFYALCLSSQSTLENRDKMYPKVYRLPLLFLFAILGCSTDKATQGTTLFKLISSDSSGIDFSNDLSFDQDFNIYTYRNFYNGGGVAMGDINNDGLLDIYFTANQKPNKLYLNRGNFKFEDISEKAGVGGTRAWSTGVSMADVNGDGWLDIYVCNSGDIKGDNKLNELFINNKDLTFTEMAQAYGVADPGYTIHAVFFDYDKDEDLDLYILNNSYQPLGSFNVRNNIRPLRDPLGGDKLMRNDGSHFVDVSEKAGIFGSVIGFGLGVTVGDINKDGWLDIYVSNDLFERDYLYLNNANGTFKEVLTEQMQSISGASMGADLADINNDGLADLFVTEMLPKDHTRLKTVTTFEDWNLYQYNLKNGYYHQFTRNMLQLNLGNGTFSEIGRLAGVEATDWSWGALMFDMDNDGHKDIFVANGIYLDLTNQDFLQYASSDGFIKSVIENKKVDYKKLVELIPSNAVSNFAFHNEGNYHFKDMAVEWGLATPSFSNGSAYGDLDNDGDLDLVVNNVNMPSFVYRNESEKVFSDNHYIKFILKGTGKNTQAIGTKITIESGKEKYYLEQMPIRGFESTVDGRPNFGLGKLTTVGHVRVEWPDGRVTELDSLKTNQVVVLEQNEGAFPDKSNDITNKPKLFTEVSDQFNIDFVHQENDFVDFDSDRLIYHMLSTEGPKISKGDVNGDGRDDFYIGGAKDHAGGLYVQLSDGNFLKTNEELFTKDQASEDTGSAFFDADHDGDLDLYVCSGGNEFPLNSTALNDRLYINNGKGGFNKSDQVLPTDKFESTSCVKAWDYDGDGDQDLFIGTRLQTFYYGKPVNGYLLINDGKGKFSNETTTRAPGLLNLGMITDACWADVDGDADPDLIVVGEWMPVKIFINESGKLTDQTERWGLAQSKGWWNVIEPADVDADGDIDFVVGNHGLNSKFRANREKPLFMYVKDFDQNGSVEQIICQYYGEVSYPIVLRHDLVNQLPDLKKKYLKYEHYADQEIDDIFTPMEMQGALKLDATLLSSVILLNVDGKYEIRTLPTEAQFSPIYGIIVEDVDGDKKMDIVLGGNFFDAKPEVGRYDASYGLFLKGNGDGTFTSISARKSGLMLQGQVRSLKTLKIGQASYLMAGRNNARIQFYRIN